MEDLKINYINLLELSEKEITHSPFYIGTMLNNVIDIIKKGLDLTKYISPTKSNILKSLQIYRTKVGLLFTLCGYISQIIAKKYQPKLDINNKSHSIIRICLFSALAVTSFIITALLPIIALLINITMTIIILKINMESLTNCLNDFK